MSISRAGNGNTTQACAACKHQRRKCASDCIFKPYFPHDQPRQFLNAHKLFGVSNINKIIKTLNPPHRDEAMRTIIFQSDVRALDPVGGCYRIIRDLQRQIEIHKAELDFVLHQLALCRAQAAQHQLSQLQLHEASTNTTFNCDVPHADHLNNNNNNTNTSFNSGDLSYNTYVQNIEEQFVVDQNNNDESSPHQAEDPGKWCTIESVSSLPVEPQHYVDGVTMI